MVMSSSCESIIVKGDCQGLTIQFPFDHSKNKLATHSLIKLLQYIVHLTL